MVHLWFCFYPERQIAFIILQSLSEYAEWTENSHPGTGGLSEPDPA